MKSPFIVKMSEFFAALTRKKKSDDGESSPLARVLTLLNLTALGVGGTLGIGVYVLAGSVAKNVAGPAVCISFLIAAIASSFAALCYAEFAARVPKAGSAYIYSYVSVGEFVAFVIGWNIILEYVIGSASVATGMSNYIDTLIGKQIKNALHEWMPINISFLSSYPDFLSFLFIMVLTAILASGVRESSLLNNIFTSINLVTLCTVIVAGAMRSDIKNWQIDPSQLNQQEKIHAGSGGFLPFGVSGVIAGAAKCLYGFVGFDTVATTAEEAKNPQKDIPLAIVITIFVVFIVYFVISTVLTMALPYYLQDAEAPFPYLFDQLDWQSVKWIVTIGAIFALSTSLLGSMFPLPRVIYAMSKDGVIFKGLSKVNAKTKTPIVATIVAGCLSGIISVIFDLEQLIDMMSIGTFMGYTIVAVSVLVLRYEPSDKENYPTIDIINKKEGTPENSVLNFFKNIINLHNFKYPTKQSSCIVNWSIILFAFVTLLFCVTVNNGKQHVFTEPFYLFAFIITIIGMVLLLVIMIRQPTSEVKLSFRVPLVPYIPCISVVINLYLMFELSIQTWIRFLLWLAVGFVVYFGYGIKHSEERKSRKETKESEKEKIEKEVTSF